MKVEVRKLKLQLNRSDTTESFKVRGIGKGEFPNYEEIFEVINDMFPKFFTKTQ